MKKKRIAVAALASCMVLTATFTGCSLVSTNNRADMAQTIATVDISKAETFADSGFSEYRSAVTEKSIVKRNIVSYFLNVGYSYIQNGYSYKDTFNMLMTALVDNAVLVQYSTLALLEAKAEEENKTAAKVLEEYNAADKTQAQKYEYLLGEDDILLAKYNLYSSINSAIDNYEKSVIEENDDKYTGTDTRTTPTNLNTEQEDYFPETVKDGKKALDYGVYTGYEKYLIKDSGAYKDNALDGTTRNTRKKAYNRFLKNLRNNNLVDTETEAENFTDVLALKYIEDEYVNQLENRIINKYYDIYEEQQEARLLEDNYIQNEYRKILDDQKDAYGKASAFESALDNMASDKFMMYSPDTSDAKLDDSIHDYGAEHGRFGLVYNILLPFNARQSARLTELNSIRTATGDDNAYFNERNRLLKDIETEDQRAAWFNGATDYSFKVSENEKYKDKEYFGDSGYLFFEGNLTDSEEGGRYEKLQAYDGRYAYNGSVHENEDGSYTLIGNKLDIDGMLDEFTSYVNFVLNDGNGGEKHVEMKYLGGNAYYGDFNNKYTEEKDGEDVTDYSKLLYAWGQVDFGAFDKDDLMNPAAESGQYKAMSAVNELQFAYTTDTGVLSKYAGYSVSAYSTSYIKEFEYAAKFAISHGEGTFAVCAGDYGWHLIYVTCVFDVGETYTPDWTRVKDKGTFENQFFEYMKSKDLSDVSSSRRDAIIKQFSKEGVSVVKYQDRYQDLLDIES